MSQNEENLETFCSSLPGASLKTGHYTTSCLNNSNWLAYKFGPLPNRTANNKTITHFLNDGLRKFYD